MWCKKNNRYVKRYLTKRKNYLEFQFSRRKNDYFPKKTFEMWLKKNNRYFNYQPYITQKRKSYLKFHFSGITNKVRL